MEESIDQVTEPLSSVIVRSIDPRQNDQRDESSVDL